LIVTSS